MNGWAYFVLGMVAAVILLALTGHLSLQGV